ncbi:MAG: Gfo/Idh/MocA family oxidoreductase [Clostridia bacterium]|nr:Gfo/Idh/MocA family oxidoreductase [Clostridia bacterium]MBQ4245150.1 Gfo/Idh/MocA family oxidoreductase [Clostridia bacterium]
MSEKVNVAVIGCGSIANCAHIPAYLKLPDVNIKYFCDIIPERADAAVEKYGCGKAVYDYHEILGDPELEAVSVCTHNDFHSIIAIDFMKAGKHVLSEKPAARILSEALEMQKVAHETGKILNIGVCNRFGTQVNNVKKLIDEGALGEVYHVYASFRAHRSIPGIGGDFTRKAASGGGALIDWGVHYLDLILYCCGEPKPLTASGEAFCKLGKDIKDYVYTSMWAEDTADKNGVYDVDDSVVGIIRTDGPVISFNGAWAQNIGVSETYIDFMGTKGGIRLNYCGDFTYYSTKDGMLTSMQTESRHNNFYDEEIKSFINCVKTGEHNQAYIDYAIETSKIMQAIYDSSDSHKEIVIE